VTCIRSTSSGTTVPAAEDGRRFSEVDDPYVSLFGGAAALIEKLKGNPLFGHVTSERTVRSPFAELATTLLQGCALPSSS